MAECIDRGEYRAKPAHHEAATVSMPDDARRDKRSGLETRRRVSTVTLSPNEPPPDENSIANHELLFNDPRSYASFLGLIRVIPQVAA